MKNFLVLCLFVLSGIFANAQTDLSLKVAPGEIGKLISEEQKLSVKKLVLEGEMTPQDLYFFKAHMPNLEELNIKNVLVDTIPEKCFYEYDGFKTIYLPKQIKYIASEAIGAYCVEPDFKIILSGHFPELDKEAFYETRAYVDLSDDNEDLILTNEFGVLYIYSSDKKHLYFSNWPITDLHVIEYDITTIHDYAFENIYISGLILPGTIEYVESYVFYNIRGRFPTYYGWINNPSIYLPAEIPPVVENNQLRLNFYNQSQHNLYVPRKSLDLYLNSPWNVFPIIPTDGNPYDPVSLSSVSEEKIRIKVQDTYYTIESDSKVKGISTYSGTGALIDTKSINDTSFQIEKRKDENMIVIISFEAGMTKSLKLM